MYCQPDYIVGLIGAIFLFGIVIGCSTVTRLGDVYGRKPVYLFGMIMHLLFVIGVVLSKNLILSFVLLLIFGVSLTGRYYVGYTYDLEMQPKSHYVLVSTTFFLMDSVVYIFVCIYFMAISKYW
jgi:MFS family permease